MSELAFGTAAEIFLLATMIYLDEKEPEDADVAVIFGETAINTDVLLASLEELFVEQEIGFLAVSGHKGTNEGELVVPGFKEIKRSLVKDLDIPGQAIVSFPLSRRALNGRPIPPSTDAEAIGLVKTAKKREWQSLYLVAPPLHLFRVFVSVASVIIKTGSPLKVWAYPCDIREWNETIVHSQTAPKAPRWDLITGELMKIERYHLGGDHVSAREVIEYMKGRYD